MLTINSALFGRGFSFPPQIGRQKQSHIWEISESKKKFLTVNLKYEPDKISKRKGSVAGAVALIIGTSIGSGILALPKKTSPAVTFLLFCHLFKGFVTKQACSSFYTNTSNMRNVNISDIIFLNGGSHVEFGLRDVKNIRFIT